MMCRATDNQLFFDRDRLRIKAFFIRFSGLTTQNPLPDSLTLLFPPRINEADFELDGSKLRPDAPVYVTLHRLVRKGEAVYGSRERVGAGEGVRFEVYMREQKVIKGIFRKGEGEDWRMECRCETEGEGAAEVAVALEGHAAMNERVEMVKRRSAVQRGKRFCCLEEIPEGIEEEKEPDGVCCCTCGRSGGGDSEEEETEEISDMELEGVRWAVDLGIWVLCLGVGYLVSRASSKTMRRRRVLL